MSVIFNGRRITHPGAYDAIDATGLSITSAGVLNIPVVVGTALSGQPGTVKWFTTPESAEAYLVGGDLLDAVKVMFSPRPEGGGGVSQVGVLITNELQRAKKAVGGLRMVSYAYGTGGNNIQTRLEDGTIAGTKRFVARRWDKNIVEVYDNLGAALTVKYTGEEAYAKATVTVVDGKATVLEIKVGADEATAVSDVQVALNGELATIDKLVQHLASIPEYEAYLSGSLVTSKSLTSALKAVEDADLKGTGALLIMDEVEDLVVQARQLSDIVYVEKDPEGTLANFADVALEGGSSAEAPASWASHFETLKTVYHDILVVLSDSPTIHAEATRHIQQMELRNQKQILFTGGGVDETTAQVKQRAQTLNSSRVVLGYPAIYIPGVEGLKPAYFTGALLAGRVAGLPATEPITFDLFNVVALGRDLVAGDPDIDELIESGVATLELTQSGAIRLAQGVTTYIGQNNTLYKEISVRRGADKISESVRKGLEDQFVGTKGLSLTVSTVTTAVIDLLRQNVASQDIHGYRNIQVSFTGTTVRVDYEVSIVEPINYVLATTHFVPNAGLTI